ncbi:DUF6011 domain-containing protein [Geomonas propionica]|uniref:DUF4258 domain-containing protein n=1 Tax=Geomonas propionica TaxID=2798582 RepID=A0ABS0YL36_9BACT|nr:DUF6011 domain-containing protein [Geomonas propionica]MBJ6798624.1 hypothetical protein [Geomonas propionica]
MALTNLTTTSPTPAYSHPPKGKEAGTREPSVAPQDARCRVCNTPLTTEASIAAGIGPVCAKKLKTILEEPLPQRKGRAVPVDPNQLGLFGATQPGLSDLLQEHTEGAIEPTSGPGEEQCLGDSRATPKCTMKVQVTITWPNQQPSLVIVISLEGGAPC